MNILNLRLINQRLIGKKFTTPEEVGFFQQTGNQPPSVVIAVDDIEDAMKNVTDAGGKVLGGMKGDGKPDDIPGVGLYASFIDTEGNRVGCYSQKVWVVSLLNNVYQW